MIQLIVLGYIFQLALAQCTPPPDSGTALGPCFGPGPSGCPVGTSCYCDTCYLAPPTTTPPPVTSSPNCTDADPNCALYEQNGFCNMTLYSEEQKKRFCSKTCGYCRPSCVDLDPNCPLYASNGFCSSPIYAEEDKAKYCLNTCFNCEFSRTTTPQYNRQTSSWYYNPWQGQSTQQWYNPYTSGWYYPTGGYQGGSTPNYPFYTGQYQGWSTQNYPIYTGPYQTNTFNYQGSTRPPVFGSNSPNVPRAVTTPRPPSFSTTQI
ncbi:unnamed protein product, partial [Mesorhabditis belari]|uniref:ShKT domain-containing protein n=1 Tax=Mesorhabditis belari TaxID=2138241 RepID=A0AAF3ENL3_9BILA